MKGPETGMTLTELHETRRKMNSGQHYVNGREKIELKQNVQSDIEHLIRKRKATQIGKSEQLSDA